ncbi:putative aBC transporter, ATP-binding protein [[Clostridium] sordellii ATCC 9714]|nr:putative aBC transporter, ATP-binding protein [[Clostridium] sordellii ATCC 9714] [Paeniclostridium sordellii ATCC 9714]
MQSEVVNESNTILEEFYDVGFETYGEIRKYVSRYGFGSDILTQKIESLSGGEKIYFNWLRFLLVKQICY